MSAGKRERMRGQQRGVQVVNEENRDKLGRRKGWIDL